MFSESVDGDRSRRTDVSDNAQQEVLNSSSLATGQAPEGSQAQTGREGQGEASRAADPERGKLIFPSDVDGSGGAPSTAGPAIDAAQRSAAATQPAGFTAGPIAMEVDQAPRPQITTPLNSAKKPVIQYGRKASSSRDQPVVNPKTEKNAANKGASAKSAKPSTFVTAKGVERSGKDRCSRCREARQAVCIANRGAPDCVACETDCSVADENEKLMKPKVERSSVGRGREEPEEDGLASDDGGSKYEEETVRARPERSTFY